MSQVGSNLNWQLPNRPGTVVLQIFSVWWLILALIFFQAQAVQAQTSISSGSTQVSASVKDHTIPSTPILIAPTNNSANVVTQKPTYSWYASTDDVGVSYYQLIVDGSVFLSNLPTNSNETSTYKLVKNDDDNSFSVTPKTAISDGDHTWRIVVFDAAGNSNTSATWSFKIDSQAPNFVLTQIGNLTVSISAQNSSTWPSQTLTVSDNPVQLAATVEANSQVKVTVSWGGEVKQTLTSNTSGAGAWSTTLGIVPRDTVITLDFLITDSFGLTTILDDIDFNIPTISPTTTPSFLPPALGGSLSPAPTLLPGEPTPTPVETSITPSPTPADLTTIAKGIIDWSWPGGQTATTTSLPWVQELILKITLNLPDAIANPIESVVTTPPSQQPIWWGMAAILTYLIGLALAWLWWWWKWRADWINVGFQGWWRTLGWIRPKKTGVVLNFELNHENKITHAPQLIKLAKITVFARTSTNPVPVEIETIFSDHAGQFAMPRWPSTKITDQTAQYSLVVSAQDKNIIKTLDFSQPTIYWPKPFTPYTYWHHQYYGGWISLKLGLDFPDLAIFTQTPAHADLAEPTWLDQLGHKLTLWSQLHLSWWPKILVLSLLVSSIWGGWLNWLSVAGLSAVGIHQVLLKSKLNIWQISLPETNQQNDWFVLTAKTAPAKAWWAQASLTENQRQLTLSCQLPKAIQNIRITPIMTTSKAPRSPVTWETDFERQGKPPMPTFNIECKPQNLI